MLDTSITRIIDKHPKLSDQEKASLQAVFQDPEIHEQLLYREKKRRLKRNILFLWIIWTIFVLCVFTWNVSDGVTFAEKGVNFFSEPVRNTIFLVIAIILCIIAIIMLFMKSDFRFINDPLKQKILRHIFLLLNPWLQYSYDGKYTFEPNDVLQTSYSFSEKKETYVWDSMQYISQSDTVRYMMRGYEKVAIRRVDKRRYIDREYIFRTIFPDVQISQEKEIQVHPDTLFASMVMLFRWRYIGLFLFMITAILLQTLQRTGVDTIFLYMIVFLWLSIFWIFVWSIICKYYMNRATIDFSKIYRIYSQDNSWRDDFFIHDVEEKIWELTRSTGTFYSFRFQKDRFYIERDGRGKYFLGSPYQSNARKIIMNYVQLYVEMREILWCIQFFAQWYREKTSVSDMLEAENLKDK